MLTTISQNKRCLVACPQNIISAGQCSCHNRGMNQINLDAPASDIVVPNKKGFLTYEELKKHLMSAYWKGFGAALADDFESAEKTINLMIIEIM
ncbi:MAG TPA: hypothetical protein PK951_10975 [Chitinophagaceae bacterium]|nr:hypothetical protein [Chitinophagaceae bacterium]